MEPDGDGQGVETALLDAASIGVLPPTLGTPDTVGETVDERAELRSQHPVEGGVRHNHAVLAVAEVQTPPPALAQVQFVQVGRILIALRPGPDGVCSQVGGLRGDLLQQPSIGVDGIGTRRRRGPHQRIGVLGGDVTGPESVSHVRHTGKCSGPLPPPPGFAMRVATVAPEHLRRIDPTIVEILDRHDGPSLRGVRRRPNTTERCHHRPQHSPSDAIERQRAQLGHQGVHQSHDPPNGVAVPRRCRSAGRAGGRAFGMLGVLREQVSHAQHTTKGV